MFITTPLILIVILLTIVHGFITRRYIQDLNALQNMYTNLVSEKYRIELDRRKTENERDSFQVELAELHAKNIELSHEIALYEQMRQREFD